MSPIQALEIITALSEGVDPATGEVLNENQALNRPDTIRALFIAKEALTKYQRSAKRKATLPENAGKSWTVDEDNELIKLFENNKDINEISSHHKRTKGSIAARLVRLGAIKERSDVYDRKNT